MSCKDRAIVEELHGGRTQFICFDRGENYESFRLETNDNTPKLNGFVKGRRYRITAEDEDEDEDEVVL